MDKLKKPLRIPPDFGNYAEERGIFQLYELMLQELIIARPVDTLQFLIDYLSRKEDDGKARLQRSFCACSHFRSLPISSVPRVIIFGPPASGQQTVVSPKYEYDVI